MDPVGRSGLSTDVRNWTLSEIENWTPGLSLSAPGSAVQVVHRRDRRVSGATLLSLATRRAGEEIGMGAQWRMK